MKKAVIYIRVRVDGNSQEVIDRQMAVCKQFADEKGFDVVETYIDNEKFGSPKQRLSLAKMLKDSRKATWDAVISYSADRITRNNRQFLEYEDKLEKHGKSLLIVTAPEISGEIKEIYRKWIKSMDERRNK